MAARSMPNRVATFSAVWPIDSPTTGSVRPLSRPMTGARLRSLKRRSADSLAPRPRAAYQPDSQRTMSSENSSGARDSASTPPATTSCERPDWMLAMAESSACMPEAQLRITVQPGTRLPQPRRSAITRPMLTSSGEGAAQPMMTSSTSVGEKGCSSARPACTARSPAENGPGPVRAFRKGVRDPSTTYTGLNAIRASLVLMRPGARRRDGSRPRQDRRGNRPP